MTRWFQTSSNGSFAPAGGLAILLAAIGAAEAQEIAIPEVVVTTPSPIARRPVRRTPVVRPVTTEPQIARARTARRSVSPRGPAVPAAGVAAAASPTVAEGPPPLGVAPLGDVPTGVLPIPTQTFSPVTVVSRSEIARIQPQSLGAALFDKPGISGTTYNPAIANRPIIRGLDNYRVRVQENGIGAHDVSQLGEDHAVPISPLISDRIEVVRGPATLRYGSGAIGGVVSSENNRIPTFVPQGGITGRLLSSYSSVDNGRLGAASVDAGGTDGYGAGVAVHADGFKTATDSYATPRGIQRNSASETQGGAVGLSYVFTGGFIGVGFSHYDALYQIPGGEAEASRTRLDPRQDKVYARGEYRFSEGPFEAVRFWVGGSNYKHDEIAIGDDGLTGVQATFKNREVEGRVELQHVPVTLPFGVLSGAVGVQADRNRITASGEAGGLLLPTDSRFVAGYLFEELALPTGTRFQVAGRIERNRALGTPALFPAGFLPTFSATGEVDADGNPVLAADDALSQVRRRRFDPKSAAVGVLQDLPYGFVGSLNAQYVERAPAAPELFSRGAHDATATFEIGDPNLKIERARTVEVGLRRAEGPLRIDATGYYTRYTGFIYKRLTGTRCGDTFDTCGSESELQQIVYSQRNATFYGAEIAAQLDVLPVRSGFVGIEAQYDFVRARFDDGTYVPRIPPHRVGGGLFWRDTGWFARVNLLHAFAHVETAPFETTTPGYDNLRAEISYTQPLDPKRYGLAEVTVGVRGDNLLDADIRNSASFKKDEILLPGRSARVFVSAKF